MTKIQKRITLDSPLKLQLRDEIVKVGFDNEAPHPLEVDASPYLSGEHNNLVTFGVTGLDMIYLHKGRSVTVLREVDEPAYKVGSVAKIGDFVFVRGAEKWQQVQRDGKLSPEWVEDASVASDERADLVTFIKGGAA